MGTRVGGNERCGSVVVVSRVEKTFGRCGPRPVPLRMHQVVCEARHVGVVSEDCAPEYASLQSVLHSPRSRGHTRPVFHAVFCRANKPPIYSPPVPAQSVSSRPPAATTGRRLQATAFWRRRCQPQNASWNASRPPPGFTSTTPSCPPLSSSLRSRRRRSTGTDMRPIYAPTAAAPARHRSGVAVARTPRRHRRGRAPRGRARPPLPPCCPSDTPRLRSGRPCPRVETGSAGRRA